MEAKLKKILASKSILDLMRLREINIQVAKIVSQRTQFTDKLIQRLGLEVELEGHQGCVNCLQWNTNGRLLASGSDDTNVILWNPLSHQQLQVLPTPHIGNIFSVKFVGDEDMIATASGDGRIIVQSVDGAVSRSAPFMDCGCHYARVKRLATAPDQPAMFWSAGEEGLVLEFDMREPHVCSSHCKVLIDLSAAYELKCIAVNPTKPHYIAIGANDCFVRLFDRRMIKVVEIKGQLDHNKRSRSAAISTESVQYYAPGHLAKENANIRSGNKLAITYISFNKAGSEMLANIGGEQIYLFDVNNPRHINEIQIPHYFPKMRSVLYKNCCAIYSSSIEVNENAEASNTANESNTDISYSTETADCVCSYMRRAIKSYKRKWLSDLYGAARDYLHVLQHWPDHLEAYIGLIRCLIALNWIDEATHWLKHFLKIYPDQQAMLSVQRTERDLETLRNTANNADSIENDIYNKAVDEHEKKLRLNSMDYEKRFMGHCNTTTDIKETNFLGDNDSYICAGSDEGIIFIWDKNNMEIVNALVGDTSIVNCIQPHPTSCLLASSGIDPAVKIWSPMPEDGSENIRTVKNLPAVVEANQKRMLMDPFDSMLARMGFQIRSPGNFEIIQSVPIYRIC